LVMPLFFGDLSDDSSEVIMVFFLFGNCIF
jgi:hypothetical protein